MALGFSRNAGGFGFLNQTVPQEIVCRIDFDGTTYAVNTPFADTSINPNLSGKTTAQLLSLSGTAGNFAGSGDSSIYRKAGAAGATTIKLAKIAQTSLVGGYIEIITGLTSSARTISIGTASQTQAITGNQACSALGTANNLVINTYPASGSHPTRASSVGSTAVWFTPDVLIHAGQEIVLTLSASDSTVIAAGSIDVRLRFASVAGTGRTRTNANMSNEVRIGSAYPIY
jgi:hypothetical protein